MFDSILKLFGQPQKTIYEKRIECLEKLLEKSKAAATVNHNEPLHLDLIKNEYIQIYTKCNEILKE